MEGEDIYNDFISQEWNCDNFKFHQKISKSCLLEAYIHEPSNHKNLMHVLKNMSYMIPYCGLKIHCSEKNYESLKELKNFNKNIIIDQSIPSSRTLWEYNNMMVNPEFWKSFESEKVLIFQTDSAVLQNNILKFIHYDYIGARWPYNPTEVDDIHIGNGGFCLRNPKICYDICRKNNLPPQWAEDVFYAKHFHYTEYAVLPEISVADEFSSELVPSLNSFGMHKTYGYNSKFFIKRLLNLNYQKIKQPLIIDVCIGCDNNIIHRSEKLTNWVKLGVSHNGINIPKDAIVPFDLGKDAPNFAGQKKYLLIKYYSQIDKKEQFCPVMLIKNKIVQYDNLIN